MNAGLVPPLLDSIQMGEKKRGEDTDEGRGEGGEGGREVREVGGEGGKGSGCAALRPLGILNQTLLTNCAPATRQTWECIAVSIALRRLTGLGVACVGTLWLVLLASWTCTQQPS